MAHQKAGVVYISVQGRQRPHHPAVHPPRLKLLPSFLILPLFRKLFSLSNGQKIQQGANVVGIQPPRLLEHFNRGRGLVAFRFRKSQIIGHLGGQPQEILPVAIGQIAPIYLMVGKFFHLFPEGYLRGMQVVQIQPMLRGLHAENQAIGNQIAIFPQRVRNIHGCNTQNPLVIGQQIGHERRQAYLQKRLLTRVGEHRAEILPIDGRIALRGGNHFEVQPLLMRQQPQGVVHDAIRNQDVATVQRIHHDLRQRINACARAAIRHRQIAHARQNGQ